jgi:prepilin-type N-terminal cleavage/methylation domain-containing protein
MQEGSGFSLMELLVAIAIISVVAAIAVPYLLLSGLEASERAAVRRCQDIAAAEVTYARANQGKYATLTELAKTGLLDSRFAVDRPAIEDYKYFSGDVAGTETDGAPPESFGFIAEPASGHGRYRYAIGPDRIARYQIAAGGFRLPDGVNPGDPVAR